MSGEAMLHHAASIVADRRKVYGEPSSFMSAVAQRWSITLGRTIAPSEVVLCLIDLKLARLAHDPTHRDSIIDVAGYAAVLQEVVR